MKKYLLTLCLILAGISGANAQWRVIGNFSGWDPTTAPLMTEQTDGTWTITLDALEGEFKFLKDDYWYESFGADYQSLVYGNGTIPLRDNGTVMIASPKMENVTISLNPEAKTATFTGLPSEMDEVDASKPYVIEKGCFMIIDSSAYQWRPDTGLAMTPGDDGCYSTAILMKTGVKFRISSALINVPEGEGMEQVAWNALHQYEYVPANVTEEIVAAGVAKVQLNEPVHLQTSTPYNIYWEIAETGIYTINIDPVAMTMVMEREEPKVYICGRVKNPKTGAINDFVTPSHANRAFYDDNFALCKIADGVFQGEFTLYDPQYSDPQFRFFSDLQGWNPDFSLGAGYEDFCFETINAFPATMPIFEGGLSNWSCPISYNEETVEMTVDLNKMEVTFVHKSDTEVAVDEISAGQPVTVWYDLQGHRVSNHSKGIYIRVTPDGAKKVQL